MKKWCKVFKLKKYDVVLLRMCNDEEGEHVQLIVRVPNGQYVRTMSFEEEVKADIFFDRYEKKHAEEFIVEFEKVLNDGPKEEESV